MSMSKAVAFVDRTMYRCLYCDGTGKVDVAGFKVKCRRCGGKGRVHGRS